MPWRTSLTDGGGSGTQARQLHSDLVDDLWRGRTQGHPRFTACVAGEIHRRLQGGHAADRGDQRADGRDAPLQFARLAMTPGRGELEETDAEIRDHACDRQDAA